jgi:hypothetical protein
VSNLTIRIVYTITAVSKKHITEEHRKAALSAEGLRHTLPTLCMTRVTIHAMTGHIALAHET